MPGTKGAVFAAVLAFLFAYNFLIGYSSPLSKREFKAKYGEWGIVAGASEGLGAAWAHYLAAQGLNVVLIARREKMLQELVGAVKKQHGVQAVGVVADLASDDLEKVVTEKVIAGRDVGMLVYNAAFDNGGPFLKRDLSSHLKSNAVNVRGPLTMAHAIGKKLAARKQGGGIVLMSSMAGTVGSAWIANYAATKAWNTAFSHGLWSELAPQNINVLGCVAGATTTPNYLNAASSSRMQFIEQTAEEVVDECAAALGSTPSTPTGPINKVVQFLFARLMPLRVSVTQFSDATKNQMHDFD
eukprot:TRINITY_DN357_c0_g1_i2.p1 TRINITY_DN357_c0_g1~~TRINITY_DN357_c0_g1_i2.p1  ORF type:complete len:322 (+),score=109.88 TRINITY_DN357_c0_g1_i2:70-966(+)